MSREEEIFKQEYFKLPNASEEDWIEATGKSNEMHQVILDSIRLFATEQTATKEVRIAELEKEVKDFDGHLTRRMDDVEKLEKQIKQTKSIISESSLLIESQRERIRVLTEALKNIQKHYMENYGTTKLYEIATEALKEQTTTNNELNKS